MNIKKNIPFVLLITAMFVVMVAALKRQPVTVTSTSEEALPQIIKAVPIKKSYSFAGESLPVDNFDVRERLDRELLVNSYYHSSTIQYMKLANRYFPRIEKILKRNGIPDDFKYLAVAESGLRNVVSKAGATGFWQLMKPVAKELGLEVYSEVDERYDYEKSTEAACKYLKKLKEQYGSWINAAGAYNLGMRKFSQAMEREKETDYLNLNLNEETMRYIFRIVAIKEIMTHPAQYGFYISGNDKYPPLDNYFEVKVTSNIENLGDFAHKYNITYRQLKIYNPWLRSHKLTVKKNTYYIKIPRG